MIKYLLLHLRWILGICLVFGCVVAEAQHKSSHVTEVAESWQPVLAAEQVKKIRDQSSIWSPRLSRRSLGQADQEKPFLIRAKNIDQLKDHLERVVPQAGILEVYPKEDALLLSISWETLLDRVLPFPGLTFVDLRDRSPREERVLSNFDLSVNKVTWLHARHPELTGEGFGLSVKEFRMDSSDIDLRGRYLPSGIAAEAISTHATNMATMIAGSGNSSISGRGVAREATLSSASFLNLLPDDITYFETSGLSLQNHSYGLDIENYYGLEAVAYDRQVYENPTLIHVFSAGNQGDSTSLAGPYTGVAGFANLTGNFKMAKNILTVGAVDSLFQVAIRSSRGPAHDGRVKPELVAYGLEGSSGAAAITSGVVTLLQQAYSDRRAGELPPAGLVRAVLLNSADDVGPAGPDFYSGYGNVNAKKAVETIVEDRFRDGRIQETEKQVFPLEIPENAYNLKVTLAWIDPPAAINTDSVLVNDLDLRLVQESSGESWSPWILNHAPHPDSLGLPARRGTDRLNNQEQISIRRPQAGRYQIEIRGQRVQQGPQAFFVAFDWEENGDFAWIYPGAQTPLAAGTEARLRWEHPKNGGTGSLAYNIIGEENWQEIAGMVELDQSYHTWLLPDTLALAQLRMTTPSGTYRSDTFSISRPMELALAFECGDSLLLSWNKQAAASTYEVFYLPGNELLPLATTKDTFLLIEDKAGLGRFFAVAPLISPDGRKGQRSLTINLDFQSPTCYIQHFFARREENRAILQLSLGSLFQLAGIEFEKWDGEQYRPIERRAADGQLQQTYEDPDLSSGRNFYRAAVSLENGQKIYSDPQSVLYSTAPYLLFPNPVPAGQDIGLFSKEVGAAECYLYDGLGRLIGQYDLFGGYNSLPIRELSPGVYFFRTRRDGQEEEAGRIVVR